MVCVLPSFPAPDVTSLMKVLDALVGVSSEFQIDVVDGNFAAPVSWPFVTNISDIKQLQSYAAKYLIEFDCMVSEPQQYFDQLAVLDPERVIIHWGSASDLTATANAARAAGWMVGLAITNDAPMYEVLQVLDQFDYVQVMGIAVVGVQGQPFDERTIGTIALLRSQDSELEIAVDGSVNQETIPALVAAGATRLAPGSAITKADDSAAAYEQLLALANQPV